ncbi:hypothetical protein DEO72_LG7g2066 [Vigna unguiculata]|uniref:Uncharacterized protein n=1 Tax=Vigna unguiculata TaxID=3917 RepID=A0A4D6MLY4_VIGUN|nr:hypothetical protein DEO72_LG7g2065 [Vigna unguiculata]QCE00776.1 hypothetical protein DEO72_LG7g2066 [Vigna unguiculata]
MESLFFPAKINGGNSATASAFHLFTAPQTCLFRVSREKARRPCPAQITASDTASCALPQVSVSGAPPKRGSVAPTPCRSFLGYT